MKAKKQTKKPPEGKIQIAAGYRPLPVFGLEQTEPAPDTHLEKVYNPLFDTDESKEIIDGYKVPWWPWFDSIRSDLFKFWKMTEPQPNFTLAATLGAAVIASLQKEHTELADLMRTLKKYDPKEIAEYIDTAAKAVERYLGIAPADSENDNGLVDRT